MRCSPGYKRWAPWWRAPRWADKPLHESPALRHCPGHSCTARAGAARYSQLGNQPTKHKEWGLWTAGHKCGAGGWAVWGAVVCARGGWALEWDTTGTKAAFPLVFVPLCFPGGCLDKSSLFFLLLCQSRRFRSAGAALWYQIKSCSI